MYNEELNTSTKIAKYGGIIWCLVVFQLVTCSNIPTNVAVRHDWEILFLNSGEHILTNGSNTNFIVCENRKVSKYIYATTKYLEVILTFICKCPRLTHRRVILNSSFYPNLMELFFLFTEIFLQPFDCFNCLTFFCKSPRKFSRCFNFKVYFLLDWLTFSTDLWLDRVFLGLPQS